MARQLHAGEEKKEKKKACGIEEGRRRGGRAHDTMESCAQKMRHRGKQKGATSQAVAQASVWGGRGNALGYWNRHYCLINSLKIVIGKYS